MYIYLTVRINMALYLVNKFWQEFFGDNILMQRISIITSYRLPVLWLPSRGDILRHLSHYYTSDFFIEGHLLCMGWPSQDWKDILGKDRTFQSIMECQSRKTPQGTLDLALRQQIKCKHWNKNSSIVITGLTIFMYWGQYVHFEFLFSK